MEERINKIYNIKIVQVRYNNFVLYFLKCNESLALKHSWFWGVP